MTETQASSLSEFSEEVREDVDGLLWLGHIEHEFDYAGHSFALRTLKAEEELFAARLTRDYQETLGQGKAWAWAHVCQALTSVDGDEEFCPTIGPDRWERARGRFSYCTSRWYWLLGNALFQNYLELAQRQLEAMNALSDLSEGSQEKSQPSPDSLTDQGDSEKLEILDHLDSIEDNTSS